MDRRKVAFALVVTAILLFVAGIALAVVGPTPGCDKADNRLACERHAYGVLTLIIIAAWLVGFLVTLVAIFQYFSHTRDIARRKEEFQARRQAALRDARSRPAVAIRDDVAVAGKQKGD